MKTKQALDLSVLSMAVLVRIVNELGGEATMKTFSQRSKAVDRITKLAEAKGVALEETYDADGNSLPPKPSAEELAAEKKAQDEIARAEKAKAEAEEKAKAGDKPKAEEKPKREKGESIRAFSEALLLEVTGHDKDGRKVGHAYGTILDKIKGKYPEAKTSVACLRWYAVHMRERGVMPPSRPRAVPVKAETGASEQKQEG